MGVAPLNLLKAAHTVCPGRAHEHMLVGLAQKHTLKGQAQEHMLMGLAHKKCSYLRNVGGPAQNFPESGFPEFWIARIPDFPISG